MTFLLILSYILNDKRYIPDAYSDWILLSVRYHVRKVKTMFVMQVIFVPYKPVTA